jgi:hypothetical protein
VPVEHIELLEALSVVGIEEDDLVDPERVQRGLDRLEAAARAFIETRVQRFLKSHGTRRTLPDGLERTRYVLTRLTHRPAYYVWFHPSLRIDDGGWRISAGGPMESALRTPKSAMAESLEV